MKAKFFNWLNQALMVDFFLVLLSFFWLAIAVAGKALGVPLGLETWYKLWQPVFTPAIGILILGSLVSGLAGWVAKRRSQTS